MWVQVSGDKNVTENSNIGLVGRVGLEYELERIDACPVCVLKRFWWANPTTKLESANFKFRGLFRVFEYLPSGLRFGGYEGPDLMGLTRVGLPKSPNRTVTRLTNTWTYPKQSIEMWQQILPQERTPWHYRRRNSRSLDTWKVLDRRLLDQPSIGETCLGRMLFFVVCKSWSGRMPFFLDKSNIRTYPN